MAAAQVTKPQPRGHFTVRVPGDKSITHRALLFASIAEGESIIRGGLDAADTRSSRSVIEAMGVRVWDDTTADYVRAIRVDGQGLRGWTVPSRELDCGNSGTTARLVMGALAGQKYSATLIGDESLRARPMRRVTTPLTEMGARFEELGAPDRLPIRVTGGPLHAIDYFSAQSSAQVKSALILAGLAGDASVTVREPRLSRDHTERMLSAMGATLQRTVDESGLHIVTIEGAAGLLPLDVQIPGDFSSAAFFVAYALMTNDVTITLPDVGLNPGRVGMLDVLRRMNAVVDVSDEREEANEPVGTLHVTAAQMRGTTINPGEVPSLIDEIPMIAALAARVDGETRINGAGELRVKETDRIHAIVANLRAVGADAEELEDGLVVRGGNGPLRGSIKTFGDHRIAMAFGVLGALPGNEITVDDPECVGVSFPGFWETLASVRAGTA